MIAAKEQDIKVTGSLPGQKISMGFAADAAGHLMTMLSKNLYSDPQLAVIREYSTNAYDAHIESGNTAPIQVTLPSSLAQFLRIRDFGVGLSLADMETIYSQYGASTKRNTNDQVGAFGLGCKSAFAYTNQFTVASVKDGRKIQVAVSRDASGAGSLTVVSDVETTDPNGTEVVIPVGRYDLHDFERKALQFFSFWMPGTVLLNGKQPEPVQGIEVGSDILVVPGNGPDRVVMGNVAYPLEAQHRIAPQLGYQHHVVARVGIGEVMLPGSREGLLYDDTTLATLKRVRLAYEKGVEGAVQAKIDQAADHREAARIAAEWHRVLRPNAHRAGRYTFQGAAIPEWMEVGTPPQIGHTGPDAMTVVNRYYHRLDSHTRTHRLSLDNVVDAWVFYDYEDITYTPVKRKRLNAFFAQQRAKGVTVNPGGPDFPETVILMKDKPSAAQMRYIDPARVTSWDEVKAIKLAQAARSVPSGRIPGSYDFWDESGHHTGVASDDVDVTKPLLWVRGNRYESRSFQPMLQRFCEDGYSLVHFSVNRVEKFKRTFPEAIEVNTFLADAADEWIDAIAKDTRIAYTMERRHVRGSFIALDESKVDDPDLKAAIRIARGLTDTTMETLNAVAREMRNSGLYEKAEAIELRKWTSPLAPYKLYSTDVLRRDPEHVYAYLNAVYAYNQKGGE